nr:hypothetical protein CFP56_18598 [Quercus suber]
MIAWALWCNRNEIYHGGEGKTGPAVALWATSYLQEYCFLHLNHVIRLQEVCMRAFKFFQRTAWKMGSDQTCVDMGIMAFQVRFKFGFQLERILLFCLICGVLGLGETDCLRYFGG